VIEPASSILIVVAVPYLVLASVAFTMSRDSRIRPAWEWLWMFGGLFALYLWVPLGLMLPGLAHMRWMSGLMAGLAYLSLLEFARLNCGRVHMFPRWVALLGFLILMTLVALGFGERPWAISLALGVPSGALASAVLVAHRRGLSGWGRTWTLLLAISLLLMPIAALVSASPACAGAAEYAPLFVIGVVAALSALLLDVWYTHNRRGSGATANRLANVAVAGLVLGAVVTAGILVARLQAKTTRQEIMSSARQQDNRIATMIDQIRDTSQRVAQSMSGSPLVLRRFTNDGPDSIANANNVIDRYANSFRAEVAYLIDARGTVLASSNRGRPDSLIGVNLSNREHFRRAMTGENYSLVARGAITRTRGLYAAAPVRDAADKVAGVAAIKSDLESLERQFGSEGYTALVDPGGLVWLATQRHWDYQRLWNRHLTATMPAAAPAPAAIADDLRELPDHPLQSGEIVMLAGQPCEVNRTLAGLEGWTLVSFVPIRPVLRTRAIALLATACAILIVLGISSSIHLFGQYTAGQQQQEMLSLSLKEMERLMSVLSHDLRTPLAAAHSSVEYLLSFPEMRGDAREVLETIADQQLRMAEMVTRLLDAMRIRNGLMEWSWEEVAVQPVLETVQRTVALLPTHVPVELDCTHAPATIRGDAQATTRLVTNLVANAIRHTSQGSVRIIATAQQTAGMPWLVIEITDTGDGIAPDVLPLLGRPFILGGKHGGSGGIGLGLSIAAGICAVHGGKLTVRSQVGRGTTFTAWLRADLPAPVRSAGEPTIQVELAVP